MRTTEKNLRSELEQARRERDTAIRNSHEALERLNQAEFGTPERQKAWEAVTAAHDTMRHAAEHVEQLRQQLANEQSLFRQSDYPVRRFFRRLVGPSPEGMKQYEPDDVVEWGNASRDNYWLAALGPFTLIVIGLSLVFYFAPVLLALGPFGLALGAATTSGVVATESVVTTVSFILLLGYAACAFIIYMLIRYPEKLILGWQTIALRKVQWHFSGSETWNTRQKMMSCLIFSGVNIFSLLAPVVAIPILIGLGVLLLRTYQRVYEQTTSTREATLATANLYAVYITYTFVAGMTYWIVSNMISLF